MIDKPKFTVITRTSGRPKFFAECRRSVLVQKEPAYHLISSDDPADTYPKGDQIVRLDAQPGRGHNLYFNTLHLWVPREYPWIIFLDDDDRFCHNNALTIISQAITSENDVILWHVDFGNARLIPHRIGEPPVAGNVSGIGFCFHLKHWVDWPGMPYGDFYVISRLYDRLKPVWVPEVLTGLQAEPGAGRRNDAV